MKPATPDDMENPTSKLLTSNGVQPSLFRQYVEFIAAVAVYAIVDRSLILIHSRVPAHLIGMFGIFAILSALSAAGQEAFVDTVVKALSPATTFIARFLPVFYIPNLIVLPLVFSKQDFGAAIYAKLGFIILCGIPFSLFLTAALVSAVRSIAKVPTLTVEVVPNVSPVSATHAWVLGIMAVFSLTAAASLSEGEAQSACVSIFLFAATVSGMLVEMTPQIVQNFVLHPALACAVTGTIGCYVVGFLTQNSFMSVQQKYITHATDIAGMGAGDWLLMGLGPVLLSFGIHMYHERLHLFRHWLELVVGAVGASLGSLVATTGTARLLGLPPSVSLAIAPRSITVALALPIGEALGVPADLLAITGSSVVCTGLLGGAIFLYLLKAGGITDPVTRGFSTGSAAMGMGTAMLAKVEAFSLPFGALAYGLVGIAGSLWVEVVPGIAPMLQSIAGVEW